jgi:1-acyl-sn-glycerol-3-phosphate acyltransferase
MHRLLPPSLPKRFWSPKLSPAWIRFWRPWRKMLLRRQEQVEQVELLGIEHLEAAIATDQGVLITPNHYTYADPYLLYEAADRVSRPFYVMTAWQVFGSSPWIKQQVLRQHGAFSVDRDNTDHRALRAAVEILEKRRNPLVVFPEGEMFRITDRIMPFCDGPAAMAMMAAKKASRPVAILPCALKYHYLDDPTPQLLPLLSQIEASIFHRPTPTKSMADRIYRLGEAALALKELEYAGKTSAGPLPGRIGALAGTILSQVEFRLGISTSGPSLDRLRRLRGIAVERVDAASGNDPAREILQQDLDDLFLVSQLLCYPGDYVAERPTVERISETIEKLEEDFLGVVFAKPKARRAAHVLFGPAISVTVEGDRREGIARLTKTLELTVQSLLDRLTAPERPWNSSPETPHVRAS